MTTEQRNKTGAAMMMNARIDINKVPPYMFSGAAAICFFFTAYFSLNDHLATATLYSGLFVVCVIFSYFPYLDSIKAFSIDVKLKRNISRAESIITSIRALSTTNAKVAFTIAAYSGRGPCITIIEKQQLIDTINKQLNDIIITDVERREVSRPYVTMIGYELYSIFSRAIRTAVGTYNQTNAEDKYQEHYNQWILKWYSLSSVDNNGHVRYDVVAPHLDSDNSLYQYMAECIDHSTLAFVNKQRLSAMECLAKEICSIYRGCIDKCGYSEKAATFIMRYGSSGVAPVELIKLVDEMSAHATGAGL